MSEAAFLPTNVLETSLMRAASDPTERPEFLRLLVESPLFVLTPAPAKTGHRTLQAGESVNFVQWLAGDRLVIPFFSSTEWMRQALAAEAPAYGFLGMKGQALFELLAPGEVSAVLNPRCPYGKEFFLNELRELASGAVFRRVHSLVIPSAHAVQLGQPPVYPTALVELLRKRLEKGADVLAAYLGWIDDPSSGVPPHAMVGLRLAPGAKADAVIPPLGMIVQSVLGPKELVDFVVMCSSDRFDAYLATTKPFFEREPETARRGLFGWLRGR